MLHDTRLQAHALLQATAAVGRTLLPPQPDDSHQSFTWSVSHDALLQGLVENRFRPGFRLRDLSVLLFDERDGVMHACRPDSVEEGFRFYEERLGRELQRPADYDRSVTRHEGELQFLSGAYAQAAEILERRRDRDATPVRLWPHHFDIAFLSGAIGVGFLAGDDTIDEPYWYVYNSPMPEELPPLAAGEWHRGDWTGAVLEGTVDRATIERFLDSALLAVR